MDILIFTTKPILELVEFEGFLAVLRCPILDSNNFCSDVGCADLLSNFQLDERVFLDASAYALNVRSFLPFHIYVDAIGLEAFTNLLYSDDGMHLLSYRTVTFH